jgi:hypothetical protein
LTPHARFLRSNIDHLARESGPGGIVWWKNHQRRKSRDTVPLIMAQDGCFHEKTEGRKSRDTVSIKRWFFNG